MPSSVIIVPDGFSSMYSDTSSLYRNLVVVAGLLVVILDLPVIHFSHENCAAGYVVTFQLGLVLTVDVGSDEDDGAVLVVVGAGRVVVDDIRVVVVSLLLSVDTSSTELST